MRASAVLLAVGALGASSCADDAAPTSSALSSAVEVRASGCSARAERGSGAAIAGGFILTAAHVVAGADSITVQAARPLGSIAIMARVVAIDAANDLALLAVPALDIAVLPVGPALHEGSTGVATVFRDDAAVAISFTVDKPVVVRILDIHQEQTVSRPGYLLGVDIEPGDSGAVLVDSSGRATGVVYANSREADHRAFATDMSALSALIDQADEVDPARGIDTGECP